MYDHGDDLVVVTGAQALTPAQFEARVWRWARIVAAGLILAIGLGLYVVLA